MCQIFIPIILTSKDKILDQIHFEDFLFVQITLCPANEEGGKEWDKGNAVKLKFEASPRKLMKISVQKCLSICW